MLLHVRGAKKVEDKLKWLQKQSRRHNNVGVIVGYTANYALWVHEAPGKYHGMIGPGGLKPRTVMRGSKKRAAKGYKGHVWDPQGRAQPKFLEQPFREHHDKMIHTIFHVTKNLGIAKGHGLDKGLMVAGLFLQRQSQELVPVMDGNLKASAFTRLITDNKGKG